MSNLQLRQYQLSDQSAVWQLHIDGLKQTGSFIDDRKYDQDVLHIKETYLDNGGEFLVALLDNKIIGIGGFSKIDDQTAEIRRMRVNADYQGQGIGSLILKTLIQKAKNLGYKKLELDTTVNMKAAIQLYEKHGFKEFKRGRAGHLESVFYRLELE